MENSRVNGCKTKEWNDDNYVTDANCFIASSKLVNRLVSATLM